MMAPDTRGPAVARDRNDLGQEFFRWEFATAVAGAILRSMRSTTQRRREQAKHEGLLAAISPQRPRHGTELDRSLAAVHRATLCLMATCRRRRKRSTPGGAAELRDRLKVATTLGYGPRVCIPPAVTQGRPPDRSFPANHRAADQDISIPGMRTPRQLEAAQAEGEPARAASARSAGVRTTARLLER